jgi:hypothetical protein
MNSNKLCQLALIHITTSPGFLCYYSIYPEQNPKREFKNCTNTRAAYPLLNTEYILGTSLGIEFEGAPENILEDYLQQYEYVMVYVRILTPDYGVLIVRSYRMYIKQLA